MSPPVSYHQDVRTLSDQELATLSAELEEAYCRSGEEDSYWTDDEAETRYWEMASEIRRREDERDPEAAARRKAACRGAMGRMGEVLLSAASSVFLGNQLYDEEFNGKKVGETLNLRTPERFVHGRQKP